jgi:glutathione S-transferase
MKLFYSPNACSLGIHALLEEIGKPYDLHWVDFSKKEQYGPDYMALNPKSKVPALLRDDGVLVTEYPAISFYLARANPAAKLLPADIDGETKALEILDYLIATVHMRGFTRIFRPENFGPSPEDKEKVQQTGRDTIAAGFKILEPQMAGKDYILGDLSIVDFALFFLEFWAATRASLPMPPAFAAHLARMMARPSVQRTLAAEGLG